MVKRGKISTPSNQAHDPPNNQAHDPPNNQAHDRSLSWLGTGTSIKSGMSKKSLKIPKGGNQNPYIEEEQTTQWPKEKVQKDKQRFTKHTHKTNDRVT